MPTSRFSLRGLAALCLLCVLPRLDALVISHTYNIGAGGTVYGSFQLLLGQTLAITPATSMPTSVEVFGTISVHLTATELNPFDVPQPLIPALGTDGVLRGFDAVPGAQHSWSTAPMIASQSSDLVLMPAHGGHSMAALFQFSPTVVLTDPDSIAAFTSPAPVMLYNSTNWATERYGETQANVTGTITINYVFSVEDGGAGVLLLLPVVLALVVHRVRGSRTFQR